MLDLHYEELALHKSSVPLAPQYDLYLARDARGEVLCVTLREEGKLVGYFVGFVAPGMHYSTCLTLIMDIYFVHPDYRRGTGGIKLFKAVEAEAKRRGVQRMFVGSKLHKDSSRLFEALRYERVEVTYSHWLGETPTPAREED